MRIAKDQLFANGVEMFEKAGVPTDIAQIVMEELVGANVYGVDSHGILRIPEYLDSIASGLIHPNAPIQIIKETPTTAVVDGNHNFGQVVAKALVDAVAQKAKKENIACAISLHANHVGRLGSYTEKLANQGLLCFATAAVYQSGPMAPWGAVEGRLGTNPLSWAAPRKGEKPIVMDFATTVVAEGKLRHYIQKGAQVPAGWIKDGYGKDTTDPKDFYREPNGTILPIGGSTGGVKGYALGLMADIFSVALADTDYWTCFAKGEQLEADNGLFIVAVNPEAFFGLDAFAAQCTKHGAYIKSAKKAAGVQEVLLPGELEYKTAAERLANGIEIPDATWNGIVSIAQNLHCKWAEGLDLVTSQTVFVKY